MAKTEPIRSNEDLNRLAEYYLKQQNWRNHSLVVLGVYTGLRIQDLLSLRWADVYDFDRKEFRKHLEVREKKTNKLRVIALNVRAIKALRLQLKNRTDTSEWIFSNGRKKDRPIGRIQAWRILHKAVEELNLGDHISCHSLRKPLGFFARMQGLASEELLVLMFGHSSWHITKLYLGFTQEELDQIYLRLKLFT